MLGDMDAASAVLNEMREDGKFTPGVILNNPLLDGGATEHRLQRALNLFAQMRAEGARPSNFTLCTLVKPLDRDSGCPRGPSRVCVRACANRWRTERWRRQVRVRRVAGPRTSAQAVVQPSCDTAVMPTWLLCHTAVMPTRLYATRLSCRHGCYAVEGSRPLRVGHAHASRFFFMPPRWAGPLCPPTATATTTTTGHHDLRRYR